jgi:hypothetical protein
MRKIAQVCLLSIAMFFLLVVQFVSAQTESVTATVLDTSMSFSGYTSPNSLVTFTDNSVLVGTTVSDSTGKFTKLFSAQTPGLHSVVIWSTDPDSLNTQPIQFDLVLTSHSELALGNIYLPPTLNVPTGVFSGNDTLNIHGYARPNSQVKISITGPDNVAFTVNTDANGAYTKQLDLRTLPSGDYAVKSELIVTGSADDSPVSETHFFSLNNNIVTTTRPTSTPGTGVCNFIFPRLCFFDFDDKGFIDFSKDLNEFLDGFTKYFGRDFNNVFDINHDGRIDSQDLSIVLYYTRGNSFTIMGIFQKENQPQRPVPVVNTSVFDITGLLGRFWQFLSQECFCLILIFVVFFLLVIIFKRRRKDEQQAESI